VRAASAVQAWTQLRLPLEQPRTSGREYARVLGVARGTLQARPTDWSGTA
jgi:hypothetical protein